MSSLLKMKENVTGRYAKNAYFNVNKYVFNIKYMKIFVLITNEMKETYLFVVGLYNET